MKNLFNKLKAGLDSLTGSQENILELTREAMKDVNSSIYLLERDGVFKCVRPLSDEFNRNVRFSLTPGKKSLVFEAVINTEPDTEFAKLAADYTPDMPNLKAGVKNDLPCLTVEFDNKDIKSADQLSKAIQSVLDGMPAALEDFANTIDLDILNVTTALLRTALRELPGVEYTSPTSSKRGATANGLCVTVKVPEFKSFRLRAGISDGDIHYIHYLQNVDTDVAVKCFKDNGLKALALEDGSVKVYGSLSRDDFGTVAALRDKLKQKISSITKSLKEINVKSPLGDAQLRGKMFDCWEIECALLENEYFKKYDEAGVVSLVIPATKSATGKEIKVAATIVPSEVFVVSVSNIKIPQTEAVEKKFAELAKKNGVSKIYFHDDVPTVGYIEEADTYATTPSGYVGLPYVMDGINAAINIWPELIDQLSLFCPEKVHTALQTLPGFKEIDKDGDMKFEFEAGDDFSYNRFMWVYVHLDYVRFQMGVNKFNTSMKIDEALDKVKSKLPKDVEYTKSDDTIRCSVKVLPGEPKLKEKGREIIDLLLKRSVEVAKLCGMPLFVLNSCALKKAFEATDLTSIETTDNYGEGNSRFYKVIYYVDDNKFGAHVHRKFGERFGLVYEDFAKDARLVDNHIMNLGIVKVGSEFAVEFEMPGRAGGYNDCNALTMDIMEFGSIANKVDDLVRDYDKKAGEIVAETRRREREEKERARQKAEFEEQLGTWHSYPVDGSDTVEDILRWFNKCYPYLRLSIIMVKTGQSADKTGASISSYDDDITMRRIHSFRGANTVKIYGRFTPEDVEKEFRTKLGLVVKVCYTDDNKNRYYISKTKSRYKKSLVQLEKEFAEKGYYYNEWH